MIWRLQSVRAPSMENGAPEADAHHLTEERPGFISLVTMAENVWVPGRVYGLSNHEIAAAIERILQADTLRVQNEQETFTAMIALRTGVGSFSDARGGRCLRLRQRDEGVPRGPGGPPHQAPAAADDCVGVGQTIAFRRLPCPSHAAGHKRRWPAPRDA